MNELEALWERLRIMNRSLEEDIQNNLADYQQTESHDEAEILYIESVELYGKREVMNEIMEIVEGMMDSEEGRPS